MNPRRSKRFTYLTLLLNALFWSVTLDISFTPISRGALAVLLIGNPLTLLYRAMNEGQLAAMFILVPFFLILWMASIISYFFLERIVRLKTSNRFPLLFIVLAFPIVWATSAYLYGATKALVTDGTRKEEYRPPTVTLTPGPRANLSPSPVNTSSVSKEDAARIVSELPGVKEFLRRSTKGKVDFIHGDDFHNIWVFHVYEERLDEFVTFNWYEVNKSTGAVETRYFSRGIIVN